MRKFIYVSIMVIFIAMATHLHSQAPVSKEASDYQYEVLSPWAQIDPLPLRGISPRLETLAGKKIGLFANYKRAAKPIQDVVERKLKGRFPDCETILYESRGMNVTESETENRAKFEEWMKGVDAVIAAVGD